VSDLHVLVGVAGEHYALPVDDVLEVAEYGTVAPLPGAPAAVLGVRNLRGNVLPVLDMAAVFGIARNGPAERVAVVERRGLKAGFAVDSVLGVERLPEASEEVSSPYLVGAALTPGSLVGVVDVGRILESVLAAPVP
jgi:purine-binding chemotaxis protein CheW